MRFLLRSCIYQKGRNTDQMDIIDAFVNVVSKTFSHVNIVFISEYCIERVSLVLMILCASEFTSCIYCVTWIALYQVLCM